MIEDAKLGKIDLIFCKSISRFARNTVVTVQTVRELKALGVGVYFDNEHFDTLGPESELVLCVLSATAQAESEHISRNVTWTLRKNMDDGLPMVNTTRFLGYDKSEDGKQLVINEDEAEIVRLIFNLYDSGEGCLRISKILQEKGYKTAAGSEVWYTSTILDILRNEKYIGELLLQKTYTVDCLTHTTKDPRYKMLKRYWRILSNYSIDLSTTNLMNYITGSVDSIDNIINDSLLIDNELYEAYNLLQDFLYKMRNLKYEDADIYLDKWIDTLYNSSIPEFNSLSSMFSNWKKEIVNSFIRFGDKRLSNGPIEGINNHIKEIKRIAFGYKVFEYFRKRIMYIINSEIPTNI